MDVAQDPPGGRTLATLREGGPPGSMDRVTRARLALMLAQPFLASAVARLPLVDATSTGWCPTAATDGYYVYVNLAFAETLSDDDLGFVLAHEVLHCVLGHPDRRGSRDRTRWNVAADYATNALLAEAGFTPPDTALFERVYVGMTAEAIYAALPEERAAGGRAATQAPDAIPDGDGGLGAGSETARSGGSRGRGRNRGRVETRPGRRLIGPAGSAHSLTTAHPGGTAGYDIHLDPGDPEGGALRAQEYPSADERQRLRAQLGQELKSKLWGNAAGYWAAELEAGTERQIPWQEVLARFVSGLRRSDYRLFPPHRKHLWRGLYLPSLGVPGPEHLVVAVDTSGSMSSLELSQVFGEIDSLRSAFECRVTVIQCDTVIHHVGEHDPWEALTVPAGRPARHKVYGRGGTDLRPPFDWVAKLATETGEAPDAVIYCTDGYGPFPLETSVRVPVLWVITQAGTSAVPFGDVVRLPQPSVGRGGS